MVYEVLVPRTPRSHDVLAVQMRRTVLGFILLRLCLYALSSQGKVVRLKPQQQQQDGQVAGGPSVVGWLVSSGGLVHAEQFRVVFNSDEHPEENS